MAIIDRIKKVADNLSALQISHEAISLLDTSDEKINILMSYIDNLQHAAYKAIEEQYAKFDPDASKNAQIDFYKRIINIKAQLRTLEFIHGDLTRKLNEKGAVYFKDENNIALSKYTYKYGRNEKRNVREHYYQLSEKISNSNDLQSQDLEFVKSLLMQIISRPEGQKLIIKLNSLLEKKGATIKIMPSHEFGCSSPMAGDAKENLDVGNESGTEVDYKKTIKRATIKTDGAKECTVFINMEYLKSMSLINTEAYASMEHGLTDSGPPFILLAHELIHATHIITGSARSDFASFFEAVEKNKDTTMDVLYPKARTKLGNSAEEYWTIEGGKICENSIRKEHGFSSRTGHISLAPGTGNGYTMRDLYFLGLQRNPTPENVAKYQNHISKLRASSEEEEMEIEKDDVFIGKVLKFEKFQLQLSSIEEVINELQHINDATLSRTIRSLERWKSKVNATQDLTAEERQERWISFLSAIPFGVCKTLLATFALIHEPGNIEDKMLAWEKAIAHIDPKNINTAVTNFQKLEQTLNSCMSLCLQSEQMNEMSAFIKMVQTMNLPASKRI
ncbi:MAG: hypothetical protein HYX61_12595 [Gammaproteobacteria bacterium]|jgi:hypothetical protein|nr:hypothetical protein [Gammaproteobacteria bacterium]